MSTDLRQGVSEATHRVLDRFDRMAPAAFTRVNVDGVLDLAQRAAAAAFRAKPENGMGRRRVEKATEAAALLLRALNVMSDDGRAE